jgi:hypothetical protein
MSFALPKQIEEAYNEILGAVLDPLIDLPFDDDGRLIGMTKAQSRAWDALDALYNALHSWDWGIEDAATVCPIKLVPGGFCLLGGSRERLTGKPFAVLSALLYDVPGTT